MGESFTAMSRPLGQTARPMGRGAGPPGQTIPSSAKTLVQELKQVVSNTEDEIYAALKECNMDPNEAAQRLLSQGRR